MDNREAYNKWSDNYDTVVNKTRDLEAIAFRRVLTSVSFSNVLEIGCGTGKNTEWLATKAKQVTGIDFSERMLEKAKAKIKTGNVKFHWADIREPWLFTEKSVDLITTSLVLEHIESLDFIFGQAAKVLSNAGYFYIGELHPFKQYLGTKAKFDTAEEIFELGCFIHHISDFFEAAKNNGFECLHLNEWFDEEEKTAAPRVISFLFQKNS